MPRSKSKILSWLIRPFTESKRIGIVFLCLVVAVVFWFFTEIDKTVNSSLVIPLNVKYDSTIIVPFEEIPQEVDLEVECSGWKLMKYAIGYQKPSLELTITSKKEIQSLNEEWVLEEAQQLFENKLKVLRLNHWSNDIGLDYINELQLELRLNSSSLKLNEELRLKGMKVNPSFIYVSGPSRYLVNFKESLALTLYDSITSTDEVIGLPLTSLEEFKKVKVHPSTVSVTIQSELIK